jgi:hypothetical protein
MRIPISKRNFLLYGTITVITVVTIIALVIGLALDFSFRDLLIMFTMAVVMGTLIGGLTSWVVTKYIYPKVGISFKEPEEK